MTIKSIWILCFVISASACGPQSQMKSAKKLEQKGKFEQAFDKYQRVAAKNPQSPLAPEGFFRAGLMAQRHLNDCAMADTFYTRVIENYPQSDPWARAAVLQRLNCPDYFPLLPGSEWVEVDSETKGKNARIQTVCNPVEGLNALPSEAGTLKTTYFAGDKESSALEYIYRKRNDELVELKSIDDPVGKVVLRWPLKVGESWKTRPGNTTFVYEIESLNEKVTVEAGEFTNCLKVGVSVSGIAGTATHEYYAPGVGKILKTVSTKDAEARVTELKSYKLGEWTLK